MVRIAMVRSIWYSSSLRVCEGATTMDSPVWMPSGSTFSMLQTVMQLSRASRTTSYSISFQPRSDSSTSTCAVPPPKARSMAASSCSFVSQIAEPLPPSEYAPRRITGRPSMRTAARTSSGLSHAAERAVFTPISSRRRLKRRRSSVSRTVSTGVPSTRTPYFASTPLVSSATPQLSAVCPPKDSVMASTSSRTITCSTKCGSTGRK